MFAGISKEAKKQIGQRLKQAARERGYTKHVLAEALGRSPAAVESYWIGRHIPPTDVALRLREVLDVPLEILFGESLAEHYSRNGNSYYHTYLAEKKENVSLQALRMRRDREKAGLSLIEMGRVLRSLWPDLPLHPTPPVVLSKIENGILSVPEVNLAYAFALGTSPCRYEVPEKPGQIIMRSQHAKRGLDLKLDADLEAGLNKLSQREQDVLMRYVVHEETYPVVGARHNLSSARAKQIESEVLEKLRSHFFAQGEPIEQQPFKRSSYDGERILCYLLDKAEPPSKMHKNDFITATLNHVWRAERKKLLSSTVRPMRYSVKTLMARDSIADLLPYTEAVTHTKE